MTPFTQVNPMALANMLTRQRLLAKPPEFFRGFCGGRIPTMAEKLFCVEQALAEVTPLHVYTNDLYEVQVFSRPPFIHLNICRHDERPCLNWEHFQQIKNEIVGTECEAVELFPAQSRLVDAGNVYHLWVHASPAFRFPVKFEHRCGVSEAGRLIELAMQVSETSAEDTLQVDQVA